MTPALSDNSDWTYATRAALLLAVDTAGLGGAWIRALPGPVRDRWLEALRAGLPLDAPWRRAPLHIADDRLLGGLDLTATLAAGRPIAERGLLAEADGGVVVLPMAERLTPSAAARMATVLDTGEVALERDGLTQRLRARIGVVALDERMDEDDPVAHALLDRVAFHLDLTAVSERDALPISIDESALAQARVRLESLRVDEQTVGALTTTAAALGIGSLRAPLLALRAARALAALDGKDFVEPHHAAEAARLVLAPGGAGRDSGRTAGATRERSYAHAGPRARPRRCAAGFSPARSTRRHAARRVTRRCAPQRHRNAARGGTLASAAAEHVEARAAGAHRGAAG